tara:strand:- start:35 stop:688 length:654 start_codon:yes stop_codon:yes gene_type:complete
MKITEQKLKQIIKEELMNESFFRKLFGMADEKATKQGLAAINKFAEMWDDSGIYAPDIENSRKHPNRQFRRMSTRAFSDAVDELTYDNPAFKQMSSAYDAAMNKTFDKKERKLLNTAYNRIQQEINAMRKLAGLSVQATQDAADADFAAKAAAKDADFAKRKAASDKYYSPEETEKRREKEEREKRTRNLKSKLGDRDVYGKGDIHSISSLEETKKK